MAIVAYSTLTPLVAARATGCPSPVIEDALRRAAIEFFKRSTAHRVFLPVFDQTEDIHEYTLTGFPTETELAQVLKLTCDGVPLDPATHDELMAFDPSYPDKDAPRPQYYTLLVKPTLSVFPVPNETVVDAFLAFVAVNPTLASTGVEQQYLEEFRDYFVEGALSRVLMITDRAWTDPQMGVAAMGKFNAGINLARGQVEKGSSRRNLTVQMRRWV